MPTERLHKTSSCRISADCKYLLSKIFTSQHDFVAGHNIKSYKSLKKIVETAIPLLSTCNESEDSSPVRISSHRRFNDTKEGLLTDGGLNSTDFTFHPQVQ